MTEMQAGDYNQHFEIFRREYEVDEKGDQRPVEHTVFAGFAKVTNLSSKEYIEALSVGAQDTLRFHTRWARIFEKMDTTTHWIKWNGRVLDILAVDDIAHAHALCTIRAKEVHDG